MYSVLVKRMNGEPRVYARLKGTPEWKLRALALTTFGINVTVNKTKGNNDFNELNEYGIYHRGMAIGTIETQRLV